MHNTKRNIVDLRLISLYHFILYCQLLFYILFYSFCFYPADSTLCALSLYKASALLVGAHKTFYLFQYFLQFIHKSIDILKFPVYRSKTHIGNCL